MRLTGKTCQRGSSTDPVHLKLSSHWRELLLGSHFVVLAVGLIFMRPSEKSFVPKPRCTALGCLFSSDSRPNDQNTKRIPAEVDKPKDTFTIGGMTSFPFSETAIAYSGIYIYSTRSVFARRCWDWFFEMWTCSSQQELEEARKALLLGKRSVVLIECLKYVHDKEFSVWHTKSIAQETIELWVCLSGAGAGGNTDKSPSQNPQMCSTPVSHANRSEIQTNNLWKWSLWGWMLC